MAGNRREDITERQITGLKYFDKLAPLLARIIHCLRNKMASNCV